MLFCRPPAKARYQQTSACPARRLQLAHNGTWCRLPCHYLRVSGLRDTEIDALRQRLADEGITVSSFHLPFLAADDIASFYETTRRAAVEHMIQWIKVAGRRGARVGVQHPTVNRDPAQENGLDRYFAQLYRSLEEMLPAARDAGVVIGLENMTPGESGGGRFFAPPPRRRRGLD